MSVEEDFLATSARPSAVLAIGGDSGELRRARAWMRDQVAGLPPEQAEDVVLVADELVANALCHGEEPRRLCLTQRAGFLRLEVQDGAQTPARPREGTTTGGRGLALVAALATTWGQRQTGDGKVVWAEFVLAGS
ncbi:ATP-binding protein [Lentzea sp. NPDC055074]